MVHFRFDVNILYNRFVDMLTRSYISGKVSTEGVMAWENDACIVLTVCYKCCGYGLSRNVRGSCD